LADEQAIETIWVSYVGWLEQHAPAAFANLAPSASKAVLTKLERSIGQSVPDELKALLRLNNGQVDPDGCPVLPGLALLSATGIVQEWQSWARLRDNETPDGLESLDDFSRALDHGVRDVYTHPRWIPVLKDGYRADYVGIDLAPAEGGTVGQVINFGRDEEQHFVAFPNLTGLLAFWLQEVQSGTCHERPAAPPDRPVAVFEHELNGIDVLRRFCDQRRAVDRFE
jgi:cell wall assembly regulator SMI1